MEWTMGNSTGSIPTQITILFPGGVGALTMCVSRCSTVKTVWFEVGAAGYWGRWRLASVSDVGNDADYVRYED